MQIRARISISADGYVTTPDGWPAQLADPSFVSGQSHGIQEFLEGKEAALMGRTTFEPALANGRWPWPHLDVFVLGSGVPADGASAPIVTDSDPVRLLEKVRAANAGGDVHLVGGPRTVETFRALGALDTLELIVLPLFLGDGMRLTPSLSADTELVLYDNADTRDAFFGPGSEPLGEEIDALLRELKESGELVATDPLADPAQTKTVRVSAGASVITDGPPAETKEHFGGYVILDCESIERAVEIAARWPSSGFDACEDAVQEALLAATVQWPVDGVPESPQAWLLTVASRRLIDERRGDLARRLREEPIAEPEASPGVGEPELMSRTHDDTLVLLFLCCHESLTAPSQIALTLRAVGGLSTAEIASAFLVPEAPMAQRISRAKATIKGTAFELPPDAARDARLGSVLHVLYLIFNEGYAASSGTRIQRVAPAEEAIGLARMLQRLLPGEDEVRGLLALMLLTAPGDTVLYELLEQIAPNPCSPSTGQSRWACSAVRQRAWTCSPRSSATTGSPAAIASRRSAATYWSWPVTPPKPRRPTRPPPRSPGAFPSASTFSAAPSRRAPPAERRRRGSPRLPSILAAPPWQGRSRARRTPRCNRRGQPSRRP